MNEMFFRIDNLQKKIESNHKIQTYLKGTGILIVFVIFFCGLKMAGTMNIAWFLSLSVIIILFVLDVYHCNRDKKYEFEIYQLKTEDLNRKKDIVRIRGEVLPDFVSECAIKKPSEEVSLPILFYAILIIVDILVKVFVLQ